VSLRLIASARPRVHHDALDWARRVAANGGSVSRATLRAVSTFCDAIDRAAIRDRFYRLNLFCGTGLTACLVPLYRGPSLSGTQFGNATDTNVNFVSGDYSESNGLQATTDGSQVATKYLNTGLLAVNLPSYTNAHLSADYKTIPGSTISGGGQWMLGGLFDSEVPLSPQLNQMRLQAAAPTSSGYNESTIVGGIIEVNRVNQAIGQRCHVIAARTSTTSLVNYRDGGLAVSSASTVNSTRMINPNSFFAVFGFVNQEFTAASFRHIISSYSMGASMTAAQASGYYAAIAAFRQALGRT